MLGFNFQSPTQSSNLDDPRSLSPDLLRELRSVYFNRLSAADACARRFGVSLDRLAQHIADAIRKPGRGRGARIPNLRAFHLDDVALAAACVDELPGAWSHLLARTEPALIAAAEVFEGRVLAVITVRRFFIDLRAVNQRDDDSRLNLRRYHGGTDLQTWISNHIATILVTAPAGGPADGPVDGEVDAGRGAENRLRLAMSMLHSERRQARRHWETLIEPVRDSRPAPGQDHG